MNTQEIKNIKLSTIRVNSNNPRKSLNQQTLDELALSIKAVGILQPIIVQNTEDPNSPYTFEIICGERRYRASLLLGLETIPAIVKIGVRADQAIEMALTENLLREDISPIEEMMVYTEFMEERGYTVEKLMERFGKSDSYIRNRMRLTQLIKEFRTLLMSEEITLATTLELCKYSKEVQAEVFDSHFADDVHYQNWRGYTTKNIIENMERNYSNDLKDYFFDKLECYNCGFNSQVASLFTDDDTCGRCMNRTCLKAKNTTYIVERAIETHERNPELPLARNDYRFDEGAIEELTAKGYQMQVVEYCKECPTPPVADSFEIEEEYQKELAKFMQETAKITEQYQKGEVKMYALIGMRGVTLSYRSVSATSSTTTIAETPLTKLENQDIRNAEIRDEKTIADIKELVKGFNPTEGDFTILEERLTYFTMLKEVRKENFNLLGVRIDGMYFLSDDDKVRIINNLTEEVKNVIRREFILSTFKDAFRDDLTAELLKEYAQQHSPKKMVEIEQKHIEVYEKRHLRIAEKIGAIIE